MGAVMANIVGGAATLTETIAQSLRDRVQLGAAVNEVVQNADHVAGRSRTEFVGRLQATLGTRWQGRL